MRARYFTVFSYIGTKFRALTNNNHHHRRSSEKIWLKDGSTLPDPESVQGIMEIALTKLRPKNFPMVHLSSRTDGGVHALNSSAHFDLELCWPDAHNPDRITYNLNNFFFKSDTPILIKKCMRVSDDFHARFQALSRTYLYRLAVLKKDVDLPENTTIGQLMPVEELSRCHFLRLRNFDIERFKAGAKHFVGYHDFGSFRRFDKLLQHKQNRRTIYHIDVRAGRPLHTSYSERTTDIVFDFWDIEIRGKSFVHNQIRRMLGTLISVAIGKLPPEEIKVMLQIPSKHSWHSFIQNCPPYGLYLCNVEYDPKDLVYEKSAKDNDSVSDSDSVQCEKDRE